MPPLRLRPVAGARREEELIFSGPRVRIGRSRDNDVILPDRDAPLSSGHHAEALLDSAGTWSIIDLSSSNGTTLNDVPVDWHAIKPGDRLSFGDAQFIVGIGETPSGLGRLWIVGAAAVVLTLVSFALVWRGPRPLSFEAIAASAAQSVFMIAVEEDGTRSIVGTAFAIDSDGLLATSAHIVGALQKRGALPAGRGPARAIAVLGDAYSVRIIASASVHPAWRAGSIRGDVAVLDLEPGPQLAPLRLADAEMFATLRRGTALAAFGFPAVSTDPRRPRGRLSVDVIGDIRGRYLEVGLGISPGTSGSPVFDTSGAVVAIVAGGDFVDAPTGARPTGSAANWALSIAALSEVPTGSR